MQPTTHISSTDDIKVTRHAAARMQQRGIDKLTVFLLREYGRRQYDGDATIRYLDRRGAEKLAGKLRELGQDMKRLRTLYLVESDDVLVTVAHRTRHHKR